MERWERLFAVAARQHCCVTVAQGERLGIGRSTLWERARREGWQRPYRGVLVVPGGAPDYLQHVAAAALSTGSGAAVGGESAAVVWGLATGCPTPVTIVVRDERSLRPQPGRALHRSRMLRGGDVVRFKDLPVTSVEWTLTDLGRIWTDTRLAGAFGIADRRRLTNLDAVATLVARRGAFPGRARVQRVIAELRGGIAHSTTERTARRLLVRAGVALYPRPYPVSHNQRRVAEIDLAVPELRYGAEIDGPHHLLPAQSRADKARDRLLGRIGWTIDRFTVEDIEQTPTAFVHQVLASLSALRAALRLSG